MRVLLVEDEAIVALMLEDMLQSNGFAVVGPVASVAAASDLARAGQFDVALLDVNLRGERTDPVARILHAAGKPYAVLTGYGAASMSGLPGGPPVLGKPVAEQDLILTLRRLAGRN